MVDTALKGDVASMEHPIFSLSTRPDYRIRKYEHRGAWIEIKPSAEGMATVHDRDILIYCISQLMAAFNKGIPMSQVVRFRAHDLLTATNRATNGRGYKLLKSALERLVGTRITTNVVTGEQEITRGFGMIESYEIVRNTRDGRMQEIEVKLSDWIYNATKSQEVLTFHRHYFRLRKAIERRLYELARKHCGRKPEWRISLELLHKKCGSISTLKEFKRSIKKVVQDDLENNHIPDYSVRMENRNGDQVVLRSRGTIPSLPSPGIANYSNILISPEAHEQARSKAPGWDVYELERHWHRWMEKSNKGVPRKPDAAFVGFCRAWFEKRGSPK